MKQITCRWKWTWIGQTLRTIGANITNWRNPQEKRKQGRPRKHMARSNGGRDGIKEIRAVSGREDGPKSCPLKIYSKWFVLYHGIEKIYTDTIGHGPYPLPLKNSCPFWLEHFSKLLTSFLINFQSKENQNASFTRTLRMANQNFKNNFAYFLFCEEQKSFYLNRTESPLCGSCIVIYYTLDLRSESYLKLWNILL